ncbi:MAG TPA: vitamin K epoxide reductase family protein [Mycobacterium sp.]
MTEPAESGPGVRVPAPRAWLVLIAGVVGLIASITLTVEKLRVLADPAYVPSCNISPLLSCGSVMVTRQASVAGIPHSLFGVVAFTVVSVTGLLAATGVALPRWYWAGLAAGTLAGAGFAHWLIFTSLYRIGALCPYCMVVWAVTIPLLVAVASIAFPPRRSRPVAQALYRWRWTLTTLWFLTLILLIFVRFQNYWSTLI